MAAEIILFTRNKKEVMMINPLKKQKNSKRAQSTLEYAVIISVVALALAAMNLYVQRAIKANLKLTEDQINAERQRNK